MTTRNGLGPTMDAEPVSEELSFGPFRIFPRARLLERDGAPLSLGSRAFDLLHILVSRAGEVVSKGELIAGAWPGLTVDETNLRFHITQLRRALGESRDGEPYIANVTGRGYSFVAPVGRGVSPSKQVQSSETPPSSHLPPRPLRIIGREADIVALAELLAARRFVTLRGPGGIGKTTLATASAHALRGRFTDGVRFLDLGSLRDPQHVVIALASALGMLVPVGDPSPRLMDSLRDREMLLVFDSCEHVVDAVARLAEQIYQQAPGVSLLTTSRESLEVAGEVVFALAPLENPPESLSGETDLGKYSSTRLFMECAVAAGCSPSLSGAESEMVARICRKLDGVPLAIELVASRLSAHALIEIDELIEGRLRLAWRGRRTAPLRHQSLSAALDWSYELISPAERILLEYLSVFPGPFTIEGAVAVACESGEPGVSTDGFEQLIAKSLVSSRPEAGRLRFRLLDTTRAYATEKLAASGSANAAGLRHARYVLQALRPRSYEPGGESPGGWNCRAELLSDARVALAWAFSGEADRELRTSLAAVCTRLFVELNLLEECRGWAARALAGPDDADGDPAAKVELLWAFGHAAMFTERTGQECEAAFWQGLKLAQQLGDLQNQFRLLSRLHALYRRTDQRKLLLQVASLAQGVADRAADPAALARAHTFVGIALHLTGDQRLARERLQAGEDGDAAIPNLPVDHFASPRGTHILSCTNLWLLGLPDQAVGIAERLMRPNANPDLVMYCAGVCYAARVYRWTGDLGALEAAIDLLEGYSRKHGFGPMLTVSFALRGELHIARGDVEEGVKLLQSALPRMIADRFETHSGALTIALVQGLAALGRLEEALASMDARIDAVAARGDSWDTPELLRVRAELRSRSGDHSGADHELLAAMDLAERQSALSWLLRAASSRVRLSGSGDGVALAQLREIHGRFSEGFDTADLRAARDILQRASS
ncbi:helix-turn-helix transcriptional regulator [Bradyrhizobium sp. Pear77]|uniref:ATP-binding protein n=1 Tax=Bradyrhizobium altum TaxID=1571202 RepID=UPI001E3E44A0|nr:winged helix-turn-helix domain-containing protein [Bradyrhizobium altum]MCC8953264.1 helix-turn-helix transcriptional regulator [Bradyrhizobium altum]